MPTTYAFSARNSRVLLNANTFMTARRWSVGVRVDELDATTFEEWGFSNYEDGVMDADISFDGFWNVNTEANRPINGQVAANNLPPLMYPGRTIANNHFYVKGAAGGTFEAIGQAAANGLGLTGGNSAVSYMFPLIKLFGANTDAETRNTVNVSFSAKNLGQFYFPGQNWQSNTNPRAIWH